jgi:hypothetical protein
MLYRAVIELLFDYGIMSDNTAWRYQTGMLDDIFSESLVMGRVFFLTAEIIIPAGGSVTVDVEIIKPGSFDFFGSGSGNVGIFGYDMLTKLDSGLQFSNMTAGLNGAEYIEIVWQNFGFDPENDILKVILDLNIPHYFIEVRVSGGRFS